MVNGKTISSYPPFKRKLYDMLNNGTSGSPYYPEFEILNELTENLSIDISKRIKTLKDEIAGEQESVASDLHLQSSSIFNRHRDLAFKSLFLMSYSSFEHCIFEIKNLLLDDCYDKTEITTQRNILDFLRKKKNLKIKDSLDLLSSAGLLDKNYDPESKINTINKLRNKIAHNNSITNDKDEELVKKVSLMKGVKINSSTGAIIINDKSFIIEIIRIYQKVLDEIFYKS